MRTRSKIFTFAAALVGLLLLPGAALAVTSEDITEEEFRTRYAPEDEDDFINCVSNEDGDTVSCEAGLFDGGTTITWTAAYNPEIANGTATVNADGTADFSFDASGVPAGSEIVVAVEGTYNGEPKVIAAVAATVEADGEIIANAGSDAAVLALGAAGAIALGGAALFVSRRKRTTTAA